MPTNPPYQPQDAKNIIYDGTALVADGNSTEIDLGVDGGCNDGELVFNITDRETGESVHLILQDYISGSFADTVYQLRGIAANGQYVFPVNNKVITGKKLRVKHDVTLPSGSDGIKIHAHFRPFN